MGVKSKVPSFTHSKATERVWKRGGIRPYQFVELFIIPWIVLAMENLCTKLELPIASPIPKT